MRLNGFYIEDYNKSLIALIEKLQKQFEKNYTLLQNVELSLKKYSTAKEIALFVTACAVLTGSQVSEVFLHLIKNVKYGKAKKTECLYSFSDFSYLNISYDDVARLLSRKKEVLTTCSMDEMGGAYEFRKKEIYYMRHEKDGKDDIIVLTNYEVYNEKTLLRIRNKKGD